MTIHSQYQNRKMLLASHASSTSILKKFPLPKTSTIVGLGRILPLLFTMFTSGDKMGSGSAANACLRSSARHQLPSPASIKARRETNAELQMPERFDVFSRPL